MPGLSSFFCCFPTQPKRNTRNGSHNPNGPRVSRTAGYGDLNEESDMFRPTSPLPRYTERPMSIYEKTIVFGRGANPQNQEEGGEPRDEKRQQDFTSDTAQTQHNNNNGAEDQSSDASSTFSVPSSFGNTSTATRLTPPPPPYSPNTSCAASQRTMSISLTGGERDAAQGAIHAEAAVPAAAQLQQPQPLLHRDHHLDQWISRNTNAGRPSWESGRSTPPLPPSYTRR